MDSLHVEGMAQDEGDLFLGADISEPVPDKHAFHGHRDIFAVWLDGPEECFGWSFVIAVQDGFPFLVQDTDVHGPGMEIDSTIKFVLIGVKSHVASSFG